MNDLYACTVPVFIKTLGGLDAVLAKARASASEGALDEDALMKDALVPGMFPFVKQVQVACDNARGATARLAGIEPPTYADTETTLEELRARVAKTIEFLKTVTPDQFAGAEERRITLPYFPGTYMRGSEYAREYAVPNFFFHVVTAYGLVRKNGVAIGKADYINGLPLRDL